MSFLEKESENVVGVYAALWMWNCINAKTKNWEYEKSLYFSYVVSCTDSHLVIGSLKERRLAPLQQSRAANTKPSYHTLHIPIARAEIGSQKERQRKQDYGYSAGWLLGMSN